MYTWAEFRDANLEIVRGRCARSSPRALSQTGGDHALRLAPGDGCPRRRYEGHFEFGRKSGHGLFLLGNGDSYDGLFEEDMYHGQGTLSRGSGDKFVGQWSRGKMVGKGSFGQVRLVQSSW